MTGSVAAQLFRRVFTVYVGIALLITSAYFIFLYFETRDDVLERLAAYQSR